MATAAPQESLNTIIYHVETSCTHIALAATFCLIANLVLSSIQSSCLPDLVRDGVIFHAGLPDYLWTVTFCRTSRTRVPRIPRVFRLPTPPLGAEIGFRIKAHISMYTAAASSTLADSREKATAVAEVGHVASSNIESEPGNFLGHATFIDNIVGALLRSRFSSHTNLIGFLVRLFP